MAPQQSDPFSTLRGGIAAKPVDRITNDGLEQLKDNIREVYKTWAAKLHAEEDESRQTQQWAAILESAIARAPQFQKLVLDGADSRNSRLQVPGSQARLASWDLVSRLLRRVRRIDDGIATLEDLVSSAIVHAQRKLVQLLRKRVSSAMKAISFDAIKDRAPIPPVPTNEYIVTLFKLAREEKSRNELRSRTYEDLKDLETQLGGIDGAPELLDSYRKLMASSNNSLVDRFTDAALKLIEKNFPEGVVRPTPLDVSTLPDELDGVRDAAEFADEGTTEYLDEGEVDESDDDDLESSSMARDAKDFDRVPETQFLREEVPELYESTPVFFYPDWAAPKSGPLSFRTPKPGEVLEASQSTQQSQIDAEAAPQTLVSKFKRSKGFVTARMLSNKEEEEAERNVTSPFDVLKAAYKYLKDATSIDNGTMSAKGFRECTEWLAGLTQRSEDAVNAKSSDPKLLMFSGFQMADNWVHVRYLLAALKCDFQPQSTDPQAISDYVYDTEKILMVIFAFIRSAPDDPLPWFLVIDGVLRMFWRNLSRKSPATTVFQTKLFNELVLWCNGTAINAFVIRLPASSGVTSEILTNWYKILYEYNPTCANEDCLRLLTHPDRMTAKGFRGVISVGTREARVGKRSVRAFISMNRDSAYSCLYDCLRICKPNKELIVVLFWYSHLFHSTTCKATRGKHAINAF